MQSRARRYTITSMFKEFKTLNPYFKQYWHRYVFGLLCLVAVDAAQLLLPQYIRKAIDAIAAGTGNTRDIVLSIGLSMAITALGIAAGRFLWRFFIHGASRRIEAHLRERLFARLMTLPTTFFHKNAAGDLMARATNDMQAIRMASGMAFVAFVDGLFMSVSILIVMFAQNPGTTVWTIAPLPLVTILIIFFGKMVGKRFKKVQEIYSDMSTVAQETLQGIRVVKSFVKEDHFSDKFSAQNDRYRDSSMSLVKVFGFFFPFISFLGGLSTLILLAAGGGAVIENRMSPGDLAAMLAYLEMLLWPMLGAGFTVNMIQRGAASLKRVNEVLNTDAEPEFASGAEPAASVLAASTVAVNVPGKGPRGDIEFRGLSYSFPDAKALALDNVSIYLRRGSCLGILGRIGSGKSTLIKMIPRIVEPPRNTVFFGGVDVGSLSLPALRSVLGFVPQDSFLFSDSIRANVLFANPDLDDARLARILEMSALDRDMELFPEGMDTVVGERGLTLSGGQKQRVAIARALAADPELLVMDDSLSAVDTETEERILEGIMAERKGRSTIIISNRVSTLKRADLVAVLDAGRLTQLGSPEELEKDPNGFFAEIAAMQALSGAGE